jgi:hypothetical protein
MCLCCGRWKSPSPSLITAFFAPHLSALRASTTISLGSWVGFCTRGKRWLGSDSGKDNPERFSVLHQQTPEWKIWLAGQIADLIW